MIHDDEEPAEGEHDGEGFKIDPSDVPELPEPSITSLRRGWIIAGLVGVCVLLIAWGAHAVYGGKRQPGERDLPPIKADARLRGKVPESIAGLDKEQPPVEDSPASPKIYASRAQADEAAVEAGYDPSINNAAADAVEEETRRMGGTMDRPSYAANTGKASGGKAPRDEEDESDDDAFMPHSLRHGKAASGDHGPEPLTPPPANLSGMDGLQGALAGTQQGMAALKALAAAQGGGVDIEDRKESFASQRDGIETLDGDEEDVGPCELGAGDPIRGSLLVAINSDVPAQNTVRLQVTQNVYCGGDRQHLAIPQGSTLVGSFNARVGYGDERIQLCFKELKRPASSGHPNGTRKNIGCAVGADIVGAIGIPADVDNHWDKVIGGSLLSALLGMAPSAAAGNQAGFAPTIAQNAAQQAGQTMNQAGQRVVQRELQRKPTLKTEMLEGAVVIFTSNIPLEPWVPRKLARPKQRRITWVTK